MDRRHMLTGAAILALSASMARAQQRGGRGGRALTDQSLAATAARLGLPGIIAGAQRRGAPQLTWRAGERVAGSGRPVRLDDRWMLGSVSKSFTATLVARLVEAGRVRWNDRVGEVLSALVPDMAPAYRDMTYRHLLSHHARIARDAPPAALERGRLRYGQDPVGVRRELTQLALRRSPQPAGFLYSNLGYAVAGAMLEARLGRSWDDLIRQHVFEPLGLSSAGIGPPKGEQPQGHRGRRPVSPEDPDSDNPYGPPGKLAMSLGDLMIYLAAHRDRTGFLTAQSWGMLQTPPFGGNYAMGWIVGQRGRMSHVGSNGLWRAEVIIDGDRMAASLTNCAVDNEIARQALETV